MFETLAPMAGHRARRIEFGILSGPAAEEALAENIPSLASSSVIDGQSFGRLVEDVAEGKVSGVGGAEAVGSGIIDVF